MFMRNIIKRRGYVSSRFQEMMYRPNGIWLKVFLFFFHEIEREKKRKSSETWFTSDLRFVSFFFSSHHLSCVFFYSFVAEMKKKIGDIWHFEVYLFRIDTVNISILSCLRALILMRVSSGGTTRFHQMDRPLNGIMHC